MFVVGGESLVDLVPPTQGASGERQALPGGSPFNCALALARLGNATGFLCPISDDEYGDILLRPLLEAGVHVLVEKRVSVPTTQATVYFNDKMQASYVFQRGADQAFSADEVLPVLPETLELFQVGGFAPISPRDAGNWLPVANAALERGAIISIDVNVRLGLIDGEDGYRQRLSEFLEMAHLIKLSEEDHEWLEPDLSIEEHAHRLLNRQNCELVVITLGERGSCAYSKAATATHGIYSPPVFGDTVGAGDSLMAGVLTSLSECGALKAGGLGALSPASLARTLRFGAVVAGLNCAHKGCRPPTRAEVDNVLAQFHNAQVGEILRRYPAE